MVRAPVLRLAVAAGLGLACGCSSYSPGCFLHRLTHPFSRGETVPAGVGGYPVGPSGAHGDAGGFEGPVVTDPGSVGTPVYPPGLPAGPTPGGPFETAPPPRSFPPGDAQRMPYQP